MGEYYAQKKGEQRSFNDNSPRQVLPLDSQKFSKFRFLQWSDSTKFTKMFSGLIKLNCYNKASPSKVYILPIHSVHCYWKDSKTYDYEFRFNMCSYRHIQQFFSYQT